MADSLAKQIALLPPDERQSWVKKLDPKAAQELAAKPWWFIGRPEQQQPSGDWSVWLILAGRGWGKTRTGAEWLIDQILAEPKTPEGIPTEWAIIAETFGDTRVMCVEGPSGILRVMNRRGMVKDIDYIYNRSAWTVVFKDGQRLHMFGADNPDAGRGYNLTGVWADEIAKWRYPYETWNEGIAPALRIGKHPRAVITTTPKPTKLLKEWVTRTDGSVYTTRGSTFDNEDNLSSTALHELKVRYEGTRIGRQELYGEILNDVEGALWNYTLIDPYRITELPEMTRIVVSIDPATTSGEDADETGIIVVGKGTDGRGYVIADRSCRDTPLGWANRAIAAYEEFKADRIVAEKNQGGEMVEQTIRTVNPLVPYKGINAKQGKRLRAEPIAALYEQGRVSHLNTLKELETQMIEWVPDSGYSPDRLDALVHGLAELGFAFGGSADRFFAGLAPSCPGCDMPNAREARACFSCGAPLTYNP